MRNPWFLVAICWLQFPCSSFAQQPSNTTSRTAELVKQLQSPDLGVRGAAKLELRASPSPEALPILLNALPTLSGEAQNGLIEVLEAYKDPSKIQALVAVAEQSGSTSLAFQLEEFGTPAAKALMASFGESCEAKYVRLVGAPYARWVGEMIGEMDDRGLPVLVEGFRSDTLCQRFAAIEGLKRYYFRNCRDYGDRGPDLGVMLFQDVATSKDSKISDAAINWINSQQINQGTCVDFSGVVESVLVAYQSDSKSHPVRAGGIACTQSRDSKDSR